MTLIEGVGDEVTVFIGLLLILLIVCLAWISTNVPDLGGIRVIILDHANFHRLGEIARRYQIIGYQIISGHIVHNREHDNREREQDSQSGVEGEETSEQSGAEDTTREMSGDDDSLNSIQTPSSENVGQSAQAEVNPIQSEPEEPATSPTAQTIQASLTSEASDSQTVERSSESASIIDQPYENRDHPVTLESTFVHGSEIGDNNVSDIGTGTNELRRRRLAFDDKSNNGASNTASQERLSHIPHDSSPAPPGDSNIPTDGSSVDQQSQSGNRDGTTESTRDSSSDSVPGRHMRVKIKYLDDRQRQVDALPNETIGEFKRKHFAGELAENMLVRFIFNGRELRHDASTLQSCNITDGSVIHCLLTRGAQQEENTEQQQQDEEFNMGALMFPLFGLILATIWYCRITYRHYFNAMSTLILVGITLLYMIAGMAMYRHHVDHHHQD